ncbi:MAG: hypothetical protein U0800_24975 [Isosphaeraceae bacterium]
MNSCLLDDTKAREEMLPEEWVLLRDRVRTMPASIRAELEPIVNDALEQAWFRNRVLTVARDALEQLHMDLQITRFDLDATRREREALQQQLDDSAA